MIVLKQVVLEADGDPPVKPYEREIGLFPLPVTSFGLDTWGKCNKTCFGLTYCYTFAP